MSTPKPLTSLGGAPKLASMPANLLMLMMICASRPGRGAGRMEVASV